MGKRGPRPKPTPLRLIEGNRGHQKLNKNEPKPAPIAPTCPVALSGAAKREWRRIAPELERLGLLTRVDRAALAAYCEAWARWREAEKKLKELGLVVRNSKMTGWMKNPWLLVADKAMEQIRAFASEFGLTPAARTRIQVPKGDVEDDWPELD